MVNRIVRLAHFTMAQPDGTRVPKTTVNWTDDEGGAHVSILDGHVVASEAQYLVGTRV